jgi:hypothetical protein
MGDEEKHFRSSAYYNAACYENIKDEHVCIDCDLSYENKIAEKYFRPSASPAGC